MESKLDISAKIEALLEEENKKDETDDNSEEFVENK